MGLYDTPAALDYISEVTGQEKVAYIGHSMGTTQIYSALPKIGDYYRNKLAIFMVAAPPLSIKHSQSYIVLLLALNWEMTF